MYEYDQYYDDSYWDDDSDAEEEINEFQLLNHLGDISPAEVIKCVYKLDRIVRNLKKVFESLEFDPFIEVEYKDVVDLHNKIKPMLNEYYGYMVMMRKGELLLKLGDTPIPANIGDAGIEEHAPAYKHNIDNGEIYRLWKKGTSIRKIAKQVGCSPDTVKRRIYSMEHGFKNK